jgi:hypothetical protein
MLSEAIPGPPDEGGHVQFENEARRIERRTSPRRRVAARPTCHSPHEHALAIDVNNGRDVPTQSLLNPWGTDFVRHCGITMRRRAAH